LLFCCRVDTLAQPHTYTHTLAHVRTHTQIHTQAHIPTHTHTHTHSVNKHKSKEKSPALRHFKHKEGALHLCVTPCSQQLPDIPDLLQRETLTLYKGLRVGVRETERKR